MTDFVVTGIDGRIFLVDVARQLPRPTDWIELAVGLEDRAILRRDERIR
ncbi:hypothetical protein FHT70_002573 [Rhizobium sp. BK049]|nr:hypothetical protein [Rhizobium sp. BK049]MBB3352640.1 hypothetical protein [Rhizobium sp. BK049]